MESHADALEGLVTALARLGPPPAQGQADPLRRIGLRVRLGRLGGVALRGRLESRQAPAFAR